MVNVHEALQRDLTILERMVAEMPGYLRSDATHWIMTKDDNMPSLTIGGCLMRYFRLQTLRDQVDEAGQEQLATAVAKLDELFAKHVVRSEHRMHQEIHARLNQWLGYLSHMSSSKIADRDYYATIVDTRVVVQAMVDKMRPSPYRLDGGVLEELTAVDNNLKGRWEIGSFVWDQVWQPAYPPETYWWMYGNPKA